MPGSTATARRIATAILPLMLAAWCGIAPGEEAPKPPPAPAPAPKPEATAPGPPAAVTELKPPLYYLKDKQGNLQAVPGFSLEEFRELYELKHLIEQKGQTPEYSFQAMTVTGAAAGAHAELAIEVRVAARDEQCRVPLRLEQAVVRKLEHDGQGQYLLHFEEGGDGYVVWISGAAGALHRLTLHAAVPLRTAGDETRLRLRCPRATTSEMKLRVPLADAAATPAEPATLLAATPLDDKGTELTVLGLGGDFELSWRPAGSPKAETPAVLEAVGESATRIDGRKATTQAGLTVKASGAAFDAFQVRLPERARLLPGPTAGYTVAPTDDRLVTVRFPEKALEQRAQLVFEQTHDPDKPDDWFELGGLEVVGAARHRGHVAVAASGDWHVLWRPSPAVRQTEELPKPLEIEGLVAGFEYTSQPSSLRARVAPKRVRVTVEPEYRLLVGAKEARLEALLKYTVRGAKVSALLVEMPGWEVDEVGPDNLVIADAVAPTEAKLVPIPLKQPTVGHVEVTVRARQDVPPGAKTLSLALPSRLQVDWPGAPSVAVLPSSVLVVPDDNVELSPDEKSMTGLARQPVPPQAALPKRQQAPLAYRGDPGGAVFAAGFRVHEREVSVESSGQVQFEEDAVRVEQRLAYTVAYEVLGTLTVLVPREIASSEGLRFSVDGQAVSAAPAPERAKAPEDAGPVPMAIALAQPRIGTCDLSVGYRLPAEKLTPKQTVLRAVPLVLPADGKVTGFHLSVAAADGIDVKPRDARWNPVEVPAGSGRPGRRLQWSAPEAPAELAVALHLEDEPAAGATVVQRAFLQTWLTSPARQDRAVYRVVSGRRELAVTLPDGAAAAEMEVLVDGRPVAAEVGPGGRVAVPLPAEAVGRPFLLEMQYHFAGARPGRGQFAVDFPRLEREVWVRRLYWQLVLPRHEHVVVTPDGFTGEFRWGWNGAFWGRTPLWSQSDLESWIGAGPRPGPPATANCYVFSALGHVRKAELQTAPRSLIVLVASLAALGAGLALIYVPALRQPASLLVAAVALGAAGVLYPEPALLALQAASLGLALTLLAAVLRRGVAARRGPSAALAVGEAVEQGSTQTQYKPPAVGSRGSTQAARALAPMSASDGNP